MNLNEYKDRMPALARIRAEQQAPKASVWYGGPADTFVQAKAEGLLAPYQSPNAKWIDEKYKDPDYYWTGVYVGGWPWSPTANGFRT